MNSDFFRCSGPFMKGLPMQRWPVALLLCLGASIPAHQAVAQCQLSDEPSDVFQPSIADLDIDGDIMAVMHHVVPNPPTGLLRLYMRSGDSWVEEAQFNIPGYQRLGWLQTVAVDEDRVIVGARGFQGNAGVAYIFHRENGVWTQEAAISRPASNGQFAVCVDLSGEVAAVATSASGLDDPVAYVFRRQGAQWSEDERFLCGSEVGHRLRSIAIENDLLVLSDDGFCTSITPSGAARIAADGNDVGNRASVASAQSTVLSCNGQIMFAFRKQGTSWVSEDINAGLVCPGADLDVEGGRIMTIAGVFSPQFNYAAMVWEYSGAAWEPQATLDFPDPSGALVPSIKAVGNRILVGSPSTNNGATGSGLAILFSEVNGTWGEAARLTPPAPTQNEYFGYSVAMNADAAAVSTSSGASGYLFDISDCDGDGFPDDCPDGCDDPQACADCNNNGTRDGCDVDCDGNGTPDDCECVALAMHTGIVPGCCNNRFIETVLPDSCQRSAARVKMMSLHHPMPPGINPSPDFSAFEYGAGCVEGPAGCVRWAGPPSTYVDSVSASTLFTASMLGCAPEYHDWGGNILLAMTGAEVAPSSVYEVQFLDEGCDPSVESNYTSPQTVETDRWGDVEFPHQDPSASDPDQPNVLDLAAIVDKVKDLPLTIPRVKAELSPQLINLNLPANAVDIGAGVDSVKGAAYPFAGPAICAN